MKHSSINLSPAQLEKFAEAVRRRSRKRKQWETAGAIVTLLATYGVLAFYIIATIWSAGRS